MIRWLVQRTVDDPDVAASRPPLGLLTAAERDQYAGYLSPRRQRDWLLGRWTAKRLVQAQLVATDDFCPALDSFSIDYEASGAPYVASFDAALRGRGEDGRLPLALSISHSHGYAFCALAGDVKGRVHLGADIELVEPRADSFVEEFFSAAEQSNLAGAPVERRELMTTATWSAKEAVLKATGLGLRVDARGVECFPGLTQPRHWTPLRVEMALGIRTFMESAGPLRAWWRVIDNRLRPGTFFVVTLAAFGAGL